MVQISEDTLLHAFGYLSDLYVRYLAKASETKNAKKANRYMSMARDVLLAMDNMQAAMDAKE
jgi:hypothetical protein